MSLFVYRLIASKPLVYRFFFYTTRKPACVSCGYHKFFCSYPQIVKINVEQIFKLLSPSTEIKSI